MNIKVNCNRSVYVKSFSLFVVTILFLFFLPGKVKAQSNQIVTNGATTAPVTFGSGCVYNWVNSNPTIGLPANGTGDIASFTASGPATASITATPAGPFAYIVNTNGTISVINTTTDHVDNTIPVDANAQGITVSGDGSQLYVSNQIAGDISVIDTKTNSTRHFVMAGYGIAVTPDGSRYYFANATTNKLIGVYTSTNTTASTTPVENNPFGVAVNATGTKVYVANHGTGSVSVYDVVNDRIAINIPLGANFGPWGVAVNPTKNFLYVTNNTDNSVSVINTLLNTVVTKISVGLNPLGVTVSPDGNFVYVANNGSGTVSIINTASNLVIATPLVGGGPSGISITPDGKKVYVTNRQSFNVSVINTSTNTVSTTIPVGPAPESFGNFIAQNTCSTITFTITVNATTASTATITATGSLAALNTVYGTPSTAAVFSVSGNNLTAGILVTPPVGFEVSTDDIMFSNTVTISAADAAASPSPQVFIRLKKTAPVGSYSGNVVLSSAGATNVNVATANSTVSKAQLNITAKDKTKTYGTSLGSVAGSTDFTPSGLQNSETIESVTITYGPGDLPTAGVGNYTGSAVASAPTGGSFTASNYSINYFKGNLIVAPATLTIKAENKSRPFGEANPVFTFTYNSFVNGEGPAQLSSLPIATTAATATTLPGDYDIIVNGATASNYTINYVKGTLSVTPVIQPIVVPNTFTPNGDGVNDTWEIQFLGSSYPKCTVEIFNRYGQRVFLSNGYGTAWDGRYKNTDLPVGVYYYVINTMVGVKPITGYVTIIR